METDDAKYWFDQKLSLSETEKFLKEIFEKSYDDYNYKIENVEKEQLIKLSIASKKEGYKEFAPKIITFKPGLTRAQIKGKTILLPIAVKIDKPYEIIEKKFKKPDNC